MTIPPQPTLAQELAELIGQQVLETDEPVRRDTDLFAAGLDSMAIMQLLLLIEQRYGTMPAEADLTPDHFATPADLARLMHARLAEQGRGTDAG